jgi:hypothetical protein
VGADYLNHRAWETLLAGNKEGFNSMMLIIMYLLANQIEPFSALAHDQEVGAGLTCPLNYLSLTNQSLAMIPCLCVRPAPSSWS